MELKELTGKKIIIFGAGLVGKKALIYFGSRNVECFADNYKVGEFYCGKHVISFEELCRIHKDYDVVLAIARIYFEEIAKQFLSASIDFAYFRKLLSPDDFESNPRLAQFRNMHKQETCFLIGNGPSLKAYDLDVLNNNNVVSFGCNRIYKIFNDTTWRPRYFFTVDSLAIRADFETIINLNLNHIFISETGERAPEPHLPANRSNESIFFFEALSLAAQNNGFSADPSRYVYIGYTVMYVMLQWAAYMGFSKIYLLGVDNNYNLLDTNSLEDKYSNHFCNNYIEEKDIIIRKSANINSNVNELNPEFLYENMTKNYKTAEAYSRKHGFRIYNATRGGNLDVFERVDFDSLFC